MKAFNAFFCSGNSLKTPKTRQAFSMVAFTFSAILDLYLLAQSHSSHSSRLRKCNVRSDWIKFTKRYDVRNTALGQVHQTGKGQSAWQKPRTTWTVWESGYQTIWFAVRFKTYIQTKLCYRGVITSSFSTKWEQRNLELESPEINS